MKKTSYIIILLTLVIIGAGIGLYGTSWKRAIRKVGADSLEMQELYSWKTSDGNVNRLICNYASDEDAVLLWLHRSRLGLWEAERGSNNLFLISEPTSGGKRFEVSDRLTGEFENHLFFCGNDAAARIESLADQLPPNVTVSIWQTGSYYVLHYVYYTELPETAGENMMVMPYDMLKAKGYVQ